MPANHIRSSGVFGAPAQLVDQVAPPSVLMLLEMLVRPWRSEKYSALRGVQEQVGVAAADAGGRLARAQVARHELVGVAVITRGPDEALRGREAERDARVDVAVGVDLHVGLEARPLLVDDHRVREADRGRRPGLGLGGRRKAGDGGEAAREHESQYQDDCPRRPSCRQTSRYRAPDLFMGSPASHEKKERSGKVGRASRPARRQDEDQPEGARIGPAGVGFPSIASSPAAEARPLVASTISSSSARRPAVSSS